MIHVRFVGLPLGSLLAEQPIVDPSNDFLQKSQLMGHHLLTMHWGMSSPVQESVSNSPASRRERGGIIVRGGWNYSRSNFVGLDEAFMGLITSFYGGEERKGSYCVDFHFAIRIPGSCSIGMCGI